MIGAVVYRLRAVNAAWLPVVHGRFMHAAFFAALRELSPELSGYVHDEMNSKPFTVSFMKPCQKMHVDRGAWQVRPDMEFYWRVTALDETILRVLLALRPGHLMQVGKLSLQITKVMANPEEHAESGILDENELIAACLGIPQVQEIELHFCSPVTFRFFDRDYPVPLPEYIWGSLADKWNQCPLPMELDVAELREQARSIIPLFWEGRTRTMYLSPQRGVMGFEGRFCYDISQQPPEQQQLFLLLAQFSVFAGVGRLTAQGLGQTRISYK